MKPMNRKELIADEEPHESGVKSSLTAKVCLKEQEDGKDCRVPPLVIHNHFPNLTITPVTKKAEPRLISPTEGSLKISIRYADIKPALKDKPSKPKLSSSSINIRPIYKEPKPKSSTPPPNETQPVDPLLSLPKGLIILPVSATENKQSTSSKENVEPKTSLSVLPAITLHAISSGNDVTINPMPLVTIEKVPTQVSVDSPKPDEPLDLAAKHDLTEHTSDQPEDEKQSSVEGTNIEDTPCDDPTIEDTPCDGPTIKEAPSDGITIKMAPVDGPTIKKAPPEGATNEKEPPDGTTIEKAPPYGITIIKKAPPDCTTIKKAPPYGITIIKKAPPDCTTIKKAPPDGTTIEKATPDGTTIEKVPPDGTTIKKAPSYGTTIKKAPSYGITIKKTPPDDTSIEKTPSDGTIIEKAAPYSITIKKAFTEGTTIIKKTPLDSTTIKEPVSIINDTPMNKSTELENRVDNKNDRKTSDTSQPYLPVIDNKRPESNRDACAETSTDINLTNEASANRCPVKTEAKLKNDAVQVSVIKRKARLKISPRLSDTQRNQRLALFSYDVEPRQIHELAAEKGNKDSPETSSHKITIKVNNNISTIVYNEKKAAISTSKHIEPLSNCVVQLTRLPLKVEKVFLRKLSRTKYQELNSERNLSPISEEVDQSKHINNSPKKNEGKNKGRSVSRKRKDKEALASQGGKILRIRNGDEVMCTKVMNKTVEPSEKTRCTFCGKLTQSTNVWRHLLAVYKLKADMDEPNEDNDDVEMFPCKTCGANLCSKAALGIHCHHLHSKTNQYECKCPCCSETFLTDVSLATHMVTHYKEILKDCTLTLPLNERPPRLIHCGLCRRSYISILSLESHLKSHSFARKNNQCKVCMKIFSRSSQLKVHMVVHTELRPFKCEQCGKTFRFKSSLRSHNYFHTGVQPYKCKMCNKRFFDSGNMIKHMRNIHKQEGEIILEDPNVGKQQKEVTKISEDSNFSSDLNKDPITTEDPKPSNEKKMLRIDEDPKPSNEKKTLRVDEDPKPSNEKKTLRVDEDPMPNKEQKKVSTIKLVMVKPTSKDETMHDTPSPDSSMDPCCSKPEQRKRPKNMFKIVSSKRKGTNNNKLIKDKKKIRITEETKPNGDQITLSGCLPVDVLVQRADKNEEELNNIQRVTMQVSRSPDSSVVSCSSKPGHRKHVKSIFKTTSKKKEKANYKLIGDKNRGVNKDVTIPNSAQEGSKDSSLPKNPQSERSIQRADESEKMLNTKNDTVVIDLDAEDNSNESHPSFSAGQTSGSVLSDSQIPGTIIIDECIPSSPEFQQESSALAQLEHLSRTMLQEQKQNAFDPYQSFIPGTAAYHQNFLPFPPDKSENSSMLFHLLTTKPGSAELQKNGLVTYTSGENVWPNGCNEEFKQSSLCHWTEGDLPVEQVTAMEPSMKCVLCDAAYMTTLELANHLLYYHRVTTRKVNNLIKSYCK